MLLTNRRSVTVRETRAAGDDGVAEGMDVEFAVAGLSWLPGWNVVERLVRTTLPAELFMPNCANTVDFEGDLPFAC
ncbi:hypothetical protein CIW50_26720 [Tardiphaga sp. P9-11]|nr:hypothetical protein CIW50_26720 [Tardiphaga sp. P9-11]